MMGRQAVDQSKLFYLFNLEEHIPTDHLLRRINPIVTRVLADLREKLAPFYSDIGRPSIDPELMIRMLVVGYCYGIRFERRLCEEVKLHLGYRWFCRLELEDKVPDHSTFSVNRHGRFRDSDIFRQVFEAVVRACMDAGLVKGEGFAVDASVMEADASRYHGKTPGEIDWSAPERQTRAVAEFLTALDDEDDDPADTGAIGAQARLARRRHGVRHWQVPPLGYRRRDHTLFGTSASGKKASCRARTLPSIGSATSTSALRVNFSGQPGRCT